MSSFLLYNIFGEQFYDIKNLEKRTKSEQERVQVNIDFLSLFRSESIFVLKTQCSKALPAVNFTVWSASTTHQCNKPTCKCVNFSCDVKSLIKLFISNDRISCVQTAAKNRLVSFVFKIVTKFKTAVYICWRNFVRNTNK